MSVGILVFCGSGSVLPAFSFLLPSLVAKWRCSADKANVGGVKKLILSFLTPPFLPVSVLMLDPVISVFLFRRRKSEKSGKEKAGEEPVVVPGVPTYGRLC